MDMFSGLGPQLTMNLAEKGTDHGIASLLCAFP